MPKISLDNLERYDGHLKDWCDARFAERKVHENWHEAGPSGAVSFYPVPNRPINPVVNFAFTETLPEGTKGPDNPSTITGVTQVKVTRCGKNLFKRPYQNASGSTIYTTTFSVDNETGTVTANTPTSSPNNAVFWLEGGTSSVRLVGGNTYFLSGCPAGGSANTYRLGLTFYSLNHEPVGPSFYEYGDGCLVTPSVDCYFVATATVRAGATVSNLVFKPQLELGSAATTFEPYEGADYTVNLGGTYYGGSVNLSTGVMTVTWTGIIYTGEENITSETGGNGYYQYGLPAPSYSVYFLDCSCTHLITGGNVGDRFYVRSSGGTGVRIYTSTFATVDSVKTWLTSQYANGTPVIVAYRHATPYTVQLTPLQIYSLSQPDPYAPRLNTVYSDQQSVLVRYPKSPIVTGSELDNAILSLGGD